MKGWQMNPWPMIRADLRALGWIAAVIVGLVAVAVAVGIALGAQERAFRTASTRAADAVPLLIGGAGSRTQLVMTAVYLQLDALPLVDGEILRRLEKDDRVADFAPIAFGDTVRGHPVVGTTAAFATRWGRLAVTEGRLFGAENEAILGADAALALGDVLTPSHAHGGRPSWPTAVGDDDGHRHEGTHYRVVGRLAPTGGPWDRAVIVPVETVWQTHGLGSGHATSGPVGRPYEAAHIPEIPAIVVKPKSFAAAYALRAEHRRGATQALFPAEVLVEVQGLVGDVERVLLVASALDDALVFLAVTALLVTVVGARRRRYAVLRALGASRAYVVAVVWGGAAVLMAAGCLIGLALGLAAARLVAALVAGHTGLALPVALGLDGVVWTAAVFALGTGFGLVPALLAHRRDVVEDLAG